MKVDLKHTVKPGRLVHVTQGAYSSYGTVGWFVCVREFCPEDELQAYLQENPDKTAQYAFDNDELLAWALTRGYLAEAKEFFDEWHLADYGNPSEVSYSSIDAVQPS